MGLAAATLVPQAAELSVPFCLTSLTSGAVEYALSRDVLPGIVVVVGFRPTVAVALERLQTYADMEGWVWFGGLQLPLRELRVLRIPWGLKAHASVEVSRWTNSHGHSGERVSIRLPDLGEMQLDLSIDAIGKSGAHGATSLRLQPGVSPDKFGRELVRGPGWFATHCRENPLAVLQLGPIVPRMAE